MTSILLFTVTFFVLWLGISFWYKQKNALKNMDEKRLLHAIPNNPYLHFCQKTLKEIYFDADPTSVSLSERKRLNLTEDAFIYGEIDFTSFIILLNKIKLSPKEIFFDLGSGSGKAVMTASIAYDLNSIGIELLPGLSAFANAQLEKAKGILSVTQNEFSKTALSRSQKIQFLNHDFMQFDFLNADILFINATCMHYQTFEKLLEKLMLLKSGSRIIITSKKISHEKFTLLFEEFIEMSWGLNSVNVYMKH